MIRYVQMRPLYFLEYTLEAKWTRSVLDTETLSQPNPIGGEFFPNNPLRVLYFLGKLTAPGSE